ncbi:hypothetical protein Taro_023433 [Colocasia esculenta]|uniref:Phospholipid-transporting ATPase n=1 Tax=Colocasia esculenta TaxID=4460 RepID=A0A843VHB0_COLES|nr:hypothetical protein [Colocasia esculenta]
MAGGRTRNIVFSKCYTFWCGKSTWRKEHLKIGGPGYSRVANVNDPGLSEAGNLNYCSNYVSTTKYTLATFVPKSLFEQFRRVANIYFLITGCLAFTPLAPYNAVSAILPLAVVIGASMVKEAIEDWRRFKQDNEVNNRKVEVHRGDGTFSYTEWKNLRVGDIVKVEKDHFFPADLILLASSYEDAICYVETTNLDGETNLKLRQALKVTSGLRDDSSFQEFKALIKCEDPNPNLYTFVGSMDYERQQYPLSPKQLLLRDSKLRNTTQVYGAVIFTGHDTKVMQNATAPPSKRSKIERKMDKIVYLLLFLLVLISTLGSIIFGIATKHDLQDSKMKRWYLRPDDPSIFFDPKRAVAAGILHCLTDLMLFSYFIPISLYVSIEICKILQSMFINQDVNMYYEEEDKPAHARTSNLNEELGQIDTILSDKTGTLTCNQMEFLKCSIAGTSYGHGITEVERAFAKRSGSSLPQESENSEQTSSYKDHRSAIKGFNFKDRRIMDGNWINEPQSDIIRKFFRSLSICHTVISEVDEQSGKVTYEAESPDEAALVVAAKEIGFEFYKRTQTCICVHELDPLSCQKVERTYELLSVLEFSSARKRMSVIVRDEEGKILLLCKGADSVMFERLAENGRIFEEETREHINEYAAAGLRTLVVAYRELDEEEYASFNKELNEAKNLLTADRDERIDEVADKIEQNLILLGATAVEDRLQDGVPECIDKLAQAGIKIWVLTGDKMETAINIGYSFVRLSYCYQSEANSSPFSFSFFNYSLLFQASKASVVRQINEGKNLLTPFSTDAFALVIDGKSLTFALEDDVKNMFLALAVGCASVICCRSSPKQKALVTRLVKTGTGQTTLAIGDGANDVGMLQEADIGIGISGSEGMQAVMASDVAIAQFRFLERLVLVHGHWCYRRLSLMVLIFLVSSCHATYPWVNKPAYNDWFLALYNVFFTSLPAIALGVFDQDVSTQYCLKFPILYQEGTQNLLFSWIRIIGWIVNGICSAITIFFFCTGTLHHQAFRKDGHVVSIDTFGATMYSCVVWVVNCQMALSISYFTLIQHIFLWGSIAVWYLFLFAYGAITPSISTTAFMIFAEQLAAAALYWIIVPLVVVAALIPYFTYAVIQMWFFPLYHAQIQWLRYDGRCKDHEYCQVLQQRSLRPNTVGYTARLEAKASLVKHRIHEAIHVRLS